MIRRLLCRDTRWIGLVERPVWQKKKRLKVANDMQYIKSKGEGDGEQREEFVARYFSGGLVNFWARYQHGNSVTGGAEWMIRGALHREWKSSLPVKLSGFTRRVPLAGTALPRGGCGFSCAYARSWESLLA